MKKTPEQASHVARCSNGKKKSTYSQAKKEAKFMKYNKKLPGVVPTPYHCNNCGWWRVGNTTR